MDLHVNEGVLFVKCALYRLAAFSRETDWKRQFDLGRVHSLFRTSSASTKHQSVVSEPIAHLVNIRLSTRNVVDDLSDDIRDLGENIDLVYQAIGL